VEDFKKISAESILASPRIGINYAKEEHRNALWRYCVLRGKIKSEKYEGAKLF